TANYSNSLTKSPPIATCFGPVQDPPPRVIWSGGNSQQSHHFFSEVQKRSKPTVGCSSRFSSQCYESTECLEKKQRFLSFTGSVRHPIAKQQRRYSKRCRSWRRLMQLRNEVSSTMASFPSRARRCQPK